MIPIIYDSITGAFHKGRDARFFEYSENNYSCDCNRCPSEEIHNQLEASYGWTTCFGCRRMIVVDVEGSLWEVEDYGDEDIVTMYTKEECLEAFNSSYPQDLVELAYQAYRQQKEANDNT